MSGEALAAGLPAPIAGFAREATWDLAGVDRNGTTVWRLGRPGAAPVRLVVAPGEPTGVAGPLDPDAPAGRLGAEAVRLRWLASSAGPADAVGPPAAPTVASAAGRPDGAGAPESSGPPGPSEGDVVAGHPTAAAPSEAVPGVPEVLAEAVDPDSGERFLVTGLPRGTPALAPEHRGDVDRFVAALADGLRRWHARPLPDARHRVDLDDLIAVAARRVAEDRVDPTGFAPVHARYTPAELLGHLRTVRAGLARRPPRDDQGPVLVHGRPTLAHTYLDRDAVTGYVGFDRSGVGDRYLDLAVIARELAEAVSPHALGPFFAAYGLPDPDVHRLDVWILLLELL